MRLADTENWSTRGSDPEPIDSMTLTRVTGLMRYLKERYQATREERITYSRIEDTPLYQSLLARLTILTAEAARPKVEPEAPKPPEGYMTVEDAATALGMTEATVTQLARTGRISGHEVRTYNGVEHVFVPIASVKRIKENEPHTPATAAMLGEQGQTTRAQKVAAPIIEVLRQMTEILQTNIVDAHDSLGKALVQITENDQIILDGMNAQHGDLVEALSVTAKGIKDHIDARVEAVHDALVEHLDSRLDRIEELARTAAEEKVAPRKGKR